MHTLKVFTLSVLTLFNIAHADVKTDIKEVAIKIQSKVDVSSATDGALRDALENLKKALSLVSSGSGLVEPTTEVEQIKAILRLGSPSAETAAILEAAYGLAESDLSGSELSGQLRAVNALKLVPDDKKAKVFDALNIAEGMGSSSGVGYALCSKYNSPSYCSTNGSAGYGLCSIFNSPSYCSTNGSAAYGICSITNSPSYCSTTASLGYGICSTKNSPSYCSTNGSLGYGLCSTKNSPSYCSTTATLAYGICSSKNSPSYCTTNGTVGYGACTTVNSPSYCSTQGTAGYGICSMHNSPSYCRTNGSMSYGVCTITNSPSNCSGRRR